MVAGSVALRKAIDAQVPGLNFFLPCLRSRLRMAIETSPKSMSTGQGFLHLWQMVQWSATSPNSSKCLSDTPRRVCSSYKNASISSEVARILLRGEYSRLARGIWVLHTGLHLPQRRQSLIESAMAPVSDASRMIDSASSRLNEGVYALRRSAPGSSLPLLKRPVGSTLRL